MTRSSYMMVFVASCALVLMGVNRAWGAASETSAKRPNIVFIFSDDLSYKDLSAYGQTQFTTPNLDRLVRGGVRFTQAYAGSPECAPSRGSLMTGMHMGHCRIRANNSVRGQDHLIEEDIEVNP